MFCVKDLRRLGRAHPLKDGRLSAKPILDVKSMALWPPSDGQGISQKAFRTKGTASPTSRVLIPAHEAGDVPHGP